MKKNLAKRIVLGLLTGAVLMSNSVAWATLNIEHNGVDIGQTNSAAVTGIAIGTKAGATGDYSIAIGTNPSGATNASGTDTIAIGRDAEAGVAPSSQPNPSYAIAIGAGSRANVTEGIAIGSNATVIGANGVAIGAGAKVEDGLGVALGKGSIAKGDVVSVGRADSDANDSTDDGLYRKIVNVEDGTSAHHAATVGQMEAITGQVNFSSYSLNYIQNNDNLTTAVVHLDAQVKANADAIANISGAGGNVVVKEDIGSGTKTELSDNFVVTDTTVDNSTTTTVTINLNDPDNPIVMDDDGITVGTNSTRMDGKGFYVWADNDNSNTNSSHVITDAIAYMNDEGEIKGVNGTFSGNVTAKEVIATKLYIDNGTGSKIDVGNELGNKADTSYVNAELDKKADQTALVAEKTAREQGDQNLQSQIDKIGGGAIAGINQRLEKTNAKINKVGAGAAALAALHPLDYDPDDKLTFSAGMGNYAGENAAALGAFYRPNEKFMLSLGGTMGNGENMVNLGLSIGLDKPNSFAKMSKRELIQEVNAVKAENEAMKDQLANADERIAKLEALVAQLVAK